MFLFEVYLRSKNDLHLHGSSTLIQRIIRKTKVSRINGIVYGLFLITPEL